MNNDEGDAPKATNDITKSNVLYGEILTGKEVKVAAPQATIDDLNFEQLQRMSLTIIGGVNAMSFDGRLRERRYRNRHTNPDLVLPDLSQQKKPTKKWSRPVTKSATKADLREERRQNNKRQRAARKNNRKR